MKTRSRIAYSVSALAAGLLMAGTAMAVSHANKYSAPLTLPYEDCGGELGTTDCMGTYTTLSPWKFSQGTIEIDDDSIGLRLDDIQLGDGYECSDLGGGTSACRCWDVGTAQYCSDSTPCTGGACGPSSEAGSDNDYFKVEVWGQVYNPNGPFCGLPGFLCPHIERDYCHQTVYFDLKNVSGNKNEDVDSQESISWGDCGNFGSAPELRHVEVYDKWGNIVAVTAFR